MPSPTPSVGPTSASWAENARSTGFFQARRTGRADAAFSRATRSVSKLLFAIISPHANLCGYLIPFSGIVTSVPLRRVAFPPPEC